MASLFLRVFPSLIGPDAVEPQRLDFGDVGGNWDHRFSGNLQRRSGTALIQQPISGLHICLTIY